MIRMKTHLVPLFATLVLVVLLCGCAGRAATPEEDTGPPDAAPPDFGPPRLWALSLGGANIARGHGIVVARGSCHVAGSVSGSATGENVVLHKVAVDGASQWQYSAGGMLRDAANDVAVDPAGNSLITGVFSDQARFGQTTLSSRGKNDIFVAKLSPAGKLLWVVSAGGSAGEESLGVATDRSGNAFITGTYSGWDMRLGNLGITPSGKEDVFVAKLSSDGKFVWALSAGGSSGDYGKHIASDPDGALYVTGTFNGAATFGGSSITSRGQTDVFVARVDAMGNLLWAVAGGSTGADFGEGVAADASGAVITGSFPGSATFGKTTLTSRGKTDIFVARVDQKGRFTWARSAGGSGADHGLSVALDSSGRSVITGYFVGKAGFGSTPLASAGSHDAFAATLSPAGAITWAEAAGGAGSDFGIDVAMDGAGRAFITGFFKGPALFGKIQLKASAPQEIFLWSLGR